jgi:YEATS domain-containing protein 4
MMFFLLLFGSRFVESVTFILHESFADPVRVVSAPPYKVDDRGWGEFVVTVRVAFRDPEEAGIETYVQLRLYPNVA